MKSLKSVMMALAFATVSMGALSVGTAGDAEASWRGRHHGWGHHGGGHHGWGHHGWGRCHWVRVCHGYRHGHHCHGHWQWVRRCWR